MDSRLKSFLSIQTLQRRSFGIVFFIIGLLALVRIGEYALTRYYTSNWDQVVEDKSAAQLAAVKAEFSGVQRQARRVAAELARHETVVDYLTRRTTDVIPLFEQVARVSRSQDVAAEVYDKSGTLIAWQGRSGTVDQREIRVALQGVLTSYVNLGPIYSQLFVITPVRVDGAIAGAVLIRQTIEVNYPLSNKFITRAGLAEKLSRELGVTVEIVYGENAEARKDGRYVSTDLTGIDGRKLGVASILRLPRSTYLETLNGRFQKVYVSLTILLLFVIAANGAVFLGRLKSIVLRALAVTALVWLIRYALLLLDFPSVLLHWGIFDPSYFASEFGGGLAKSIGDMTLTSLALFFNTAVVIRMVIKSSVAGNDRLRSAVLPLRLLAAFAITCLIFLMLRGYGATIRSAVFDSTLRFNDPLVIVPSFELGLMAFNLFTISVCLIGTAAALTAYTASLLTPHGAKRSTVAWFIVGLCYAAGAVLFEVVQHTPLMSTGFRLFFGAGIVTFTLFVLRKPSRWSSPFSFGSVLFMLALAAVFFYPLLDEFIHERDRERVEVFARDVLRPADAWFKFVIDESLQTFVSDASFDVMLNGDREEIERLAFTCWAGSNAARQGYNCSFAVLDSAGHELSRFAIGEQGPAVTAAESAILHNGSKQVDVRQAGSGVNALKIYTGSIPIVASDQLLGYGIVVISAAQQSLFRGETPRVFRTASQENLELFYRPIVVSEFRGDSLLTTTDAMLPIGYRMPAEVRERFSDTLATSAWCNETIDGRQYETYFIRPATAEKRIVSLRLEQPDLQWYLFGVVRILLYYAFILVAAIIALLLYQWARGRPYQFTFRDRLLVMLLITSVLPAVVISNYTRIFARERLIENVSQRLFIETETFEDQLRRENITDAMNPRDSVRASAERLASSMKADFNIYLGSTLQMSSRPELYDAGILDRRLIGSAYAWIFAGGERFHLETENIGLYRYAVGYRPLLNNAGKIVGAISVPTLYRQEQIDEDVARTNGVLFGVSAIIVIAIVLIAIAMANRIASPIHKLTEATKRVSLGDLDVKVNARADGEIEELIRSFETMTMDLKRSRENLVQYERELAWKEMAKQVAHEIKNPLTPMKLAMQHLRQTYRDKVENFDEVFEEVSQMVIRQVDALSRIASEFSSFARMPHAKLEPCSINDILREAVYLFERDDKVKFSVNVDPHIPPVLTDREELRRAFINIIRNGIQAMDGEGQMIVSTEHRENDIEIRIQDFGCGVPEEIRNKLFQPNFSTKTDGMGLGLAIVKKTVEDMNGHITLESTLNEGTTVFIHIPYTTGDHAADSYHQS